MQRVVGCEQERVLGEAARSSSDAVLVLDPDSVLLALNPAAAAWLGVDPAVATGSRLADLAHLSAVVAANRSLLQDMWRLLHHLVETGTVFGDDEMTVFSGAGRLQVASTRLEPHLVDGRHRVTWSLRFLDERRAIFRASSVAMARLDREGRLLQANAAMAALSGLAEETLVGGAYTRLVHDDDVGGAAAALDATLASGRAVGEHRIRRPDGEVRDVRMTTTLVEGAQPWDSFVLAVVEDVTDRVAAEVEVRRNSADQQVLARVAGVALAATEAQGLREEVHHILTCAGGAAAVVVTGPDSVHVGDEPAEAGLAAFSRAVDGGGRLHTWFPDDTLSRRSGRMLTDATANLLSTGLARLRAETALRARAQRDPLTGLYNRRLLLQRTESALAHRSGDSAVGLLFVDLDGFKPVNDRLGHAAGDDLLTQVAARLSALLRGGDTVARWGGDEFVVLLVGISDHQEAAAVAARLEAELSRPYQLDGSDVLIGASVGVGLAAGPTTAAELLEQADSRMYEVKQTRRSR